MTISEPVVKALLSIGVYNKAILDILAGEGVHEQGEQALQILDALNSTRVSKLSLFRDMEWDFNDDNPNASRLLKGVRLKVNFGRYDDIPEAVILEMKCVAFLYMNLPGFFKAEDVSNKKAVKVLKPQTHVVHVDHALKFVNQLYLVLREELGSFYIDETMQSLSSIPSCYYGQAAAIYPWAYNSPMELFFRAIQSPRLQGTLFSSAVPTVVFDNLPWLRVGSEKSSAEEVEEKPSKVLRNDLFEHSTSIASMVIVDFLDALGQEVVDQTSLRVRNSKRFYQSRDNGLTSTKLSLYTCYRLYRAGHSVSLLKAHWPEGCEVIDKIFKGDHFGNIRKICGNLLGSDFDTQFKEYIGYVTYSCMYVVAQFTGMRPGELVRLLGDSCLKEDKEGGYWLISSIVEKHQQNLTGLFDDYWVAIPIVRDAILASALLSKLKNNPYVFSKAHTIPFGEVALPFSSSGFNHPMEKFFKGFLSDDEVEKIGYYPYMLRHTLAYQLFRADLGLPFISHQLKHFGELIGRPEIGRSFSKTTLAYGEVGDMLSKGGRMGVDGASIKRQAELECVKSMFDPEGNYAGANAVEHKAALQKEFAGYMAAGYTTDEVFEYMVDQHIAIINVGGAFCYGGRQEEFDSSLPCIGGLRCNPNRCSNAVVTEAHAPAWKDVYEQNKKSLRDPRLQHSQQHYKAAMDEARLVLVNLGIEVEE